MNAYEQLISDYLSGAASPDQMDQLHQVLATDSEAQQAFLAATRVHAGLKRTALAAMPAPALAFAQPETQAKTYSWPAVIAIAAAILLFVALSRFEAPSTTATSTELAATEHNHRQIRIAVTGSGPVATACLGNAGRAQHKNGQRIYSALASNRDHAIAFIPINISP